MTGYTPVSKYGILKNQNHENDTMKNRSKVEPISHDEWYKELFKERKTEVPEGFFCVADICEKTGFNYSTVGKKLSAGVREKKMEVIVIHNEQGRGVNYYKPIKK